MRALNLKEKTYWRILTSIVTIFLLFVMTGTVIDELINTYRFEEKTVNYRIESKVDHSFILKDGNLSNIDYVDIKELDKLQLDFNYRISMSEYFYPQSNYEVTIDFKKYDEGIAELIDTDIIKLETSAFEDEASTSYVLEELVILDSDKLSVLNSSGQIHLISVELKSKTDLLLFNYGANIKENSILRLEIDLNEDALTVRPTGDHAFKTKHLNTPISREINKPLIIICAVFFLLLLPLTLISLKEVYNLTSFAEYERKLKYIKRVYGREILSIANKPEFDEMKTIDIKNIDELALISQELELPIQSYVNDAQSYVTYSVVGKKITYRYNLHI